MDLFNPEASFPPSRCVNAQGFSLHANVSCGPYQRHTVERLCCYITRPALGHNRLSRTPDGEVVLQLKTPYRDGSTHEVVAPLGFFQYLAENCQFKPNFTPSTPGAGNLIPDKSMSDVEDNCLFRVEFSLS